MKNDILSYWEMCSRQGMALQRGMYFRPPPLYGIILMSRRPNAPYSDSMSDDESTLAYEGHDEKRIAGGPNPKEVDQPLHDHRGQLTQNGQFVEWIEKCKKGIVPPAVFRVYEKLRPGIWTDRGLYKLDDYRVEQQGRRVFKFILSQVNYDSTDSRTLHVKEAPASRQIPTWVKQEVFKRDKGRCVICGAGDQLHFDHELPFSKGGASILPENVRILCARHNLAKSNKIE